jgi:hypothetical protein
MIALSIAYVAIENVLVSDVKPWLASVIPPTQRGAWIASFAALQALNAALFYTWRPLY